MLYTTGVIAVIAIFMCCWSWLMARHAKRWRLWWMSRFGIPDLNSTREQRRQQEFQLSIAAYLFFAMWLAAGAYCIWWVVDEVQEVHNKSAFDIAKEKAMHDVDRMRPKLRKLR
jgi:uncharacterized membrane protein